MTGASDYHHNVLTVDLVNSKDCVTIIIVFIITIIIVFIITVV